MPKPKTGTGPKPKVSPPPRYESGRKKADVVEGIAPTLLKRLKDEVIPRAKDRRLGTVLGIMHLEGLLTETETEAGFLYAEDVGRYEKAMGHPRRTARSPSFDAGFGGGGLDLDLLRRLDPERAERLEDKLRRQKSVAVKNFKRTQKFVPDHPLARALIDDLCCNNVRISPLHHSGIKAILALLARDCYRLQGNEERKAPKKPSRADAVHMAEAACDVLTDWFKREKATIHAFDIVAGSHKRRRLTCYGVKQDGMSSINHSVEIDIKHFMAAAIDAQLLKSALKREWNEVCQRRTA